MARHEQLQAAALLAVLMALLLVGVVSGTIVRHLVQVLPVLVAALVVLFRPSWSGFAAAPVFAFWLFIMLLIWLYLLGLATVVSGHFTPVEIGLTVVIGLASCLGLGASLRRTRVANWRAGAAVFLMSGALQVGAMWLSLQPAIAGR